MDGFDYADEVPVVTLIELWPSHVITRYKSIPPCTSRDAHVCRIVCKLTSSNFT